MRVRLMVGMRQGADERPQVAEDVAKQLARTGSFEVMGFSIGGALKDDLERSDLKIMHPADHDVLLVQFGQRAGIRRELRALVADLEQRGAAPRSSRCHLTRPGGFMSTWTPSPPTSSVR